ncbi:hypothetical protein ACJZ2D_007732 [Fusarium nematophilum]
MSTEGIRALDDKRLVAAEHRNETALGVLGSVWRFLGGEGEAHDATSRSEDRLLVSAGYDKAKGEQRFLGTWKSLKGKLFLVEGRKRPGTDILSRTKSASNRAFGKSSVLRNGAEAYGFLSCIELQLCPPGEDITMDEQPLLSPPMLPTIPYSEEVPEHAAAPAGLGGHPPQLEISNRDDFPADIQEC